MKERIGRGNQGLEMFYEINVFINHGYHFFDVE